MSATHSRLENSRKTTCSLLFSRRFLAPAFAAIFFASCGLVMHAGAQKGNSHEKKNQGGPSATDDGRKTFETVCATCHGLDGRGGERGPNVATRAEVQQLSDEKTLHILQEGIPAAGMPAFRALGAAKLTAVMAYLRLLQGGGVAVSVPGDSKSGKSLFFGKAGCAKCHMINGSGGFIGTDLSSYGLNASIEEIRSAITDPNKELDPRKRTALVTTREGRQFTGMARNEDNFSLQLQSLDGAFHLIAKADIEHLEYQPKSLMPADYGSILTRSELDDLVSYLLRAAQSTKQTHGKKSKEEEYEE